MEGLRRGTNDRDGRVRCDRADVRDQHHRPLGHRTCLPASNPRSRRRRAYRQGVVEAESGGTDDPVDDHESRAWIRLLQARSQRDDGLAVHRTELLLSACRSMPYTPGECARISGAGCSAARGQGACTVAWLANHPDEGPTGMLFQQRAAIPWCAGSGRIGSEPSSGHPSPQAIRAVVIPVTVTRPNQSTDDALRLWPAMFWYSATAASPVTGSPVSV